MKNIYVAVDKKHTAILFSKEMMKKYLNIFPNAKFKICSDITTAVEKAKPEDYFSPKVFAIKNGLVKGMCFTATEYQALVNGVKNVKGKKCRNVEDAFKYIYSKSIPKNLNITAVKDETVNPKSNNIAYVDGSYNDTTNVMGIAYTLQNKKLYFTHSSFIKLDIRGSSVIAELLSTMMVIDRAIKEKLKDITIVHDNEQIQSILKNEKNKNEFNKKYYDFITESSKFINIKFKKIKSHSGDENNNIVDRLARQYNINKFINMLTAPPI